MNEVPDGLAPVKSPAEGLKAAQQFRDQGDTTAELRVLGGVTARFPEVYEAWGRGADLFLRERRLEEAEAWTGKGLIHCPDDFYLLLQFARIAEERQDWAAAAGRWRRFGSCHPSSWYGHVRGAVALRILGRLDEAEAMVLAARAQLPASPELAVEYARIAESRRDWQEALRRWTEARELLPDEWRCPAGAAGALRELHRFDEADAMFEVALARNPAEPEMLLGYAQVAEARRDAEAAVRRWTAARDRFPDRWLFHAAAADWLRQLGRLEEAEARLIEAQQRLPTEPVLFIDYARLAEANRDWTEAQRRWTEVARRFPGSWVGYVGAAHALRELGRTDEADAELVAGQVQCPDQTELYVEYARNAESRGDWDAALQRWTEVQARSPAQWNAFLRAAAALTALHRYHDAETLLLEAEARFPDEFALAAEGARLAARHSDRNDAVRRWEDVRERFPDRPEAWIGVATALADAGCGEDAIVRIRQALDRHADHFELRIAEASLYMRLRLPDRALAAWELVRRDFSDQPIGYVRGADALVNSGRDEEAEALLVDAAGRFPNHLDIDRARALIAARGDDLAAAAQLLEAVVERAKGDRLVALTWVDTLRRLQRAVEARSAVHTAIQRFPSDLELIRQGIWIALQSADFDEAVALWASTVGDPAFPQEHTFHLGCHLLNEKVPERHTRVLLQHLVREPDTGERYWRPLLVTVLRSDRMRPEQMQILADLVRTSPPDAFTPAIRDISRAVLQLDLTPEDIRRFFDTYLARDRLGVAGCLFTDIDRPSEHNTRVRTLFEAYVGDRLRRRHWINHADAGEIVALLQFAAVASHTAYRQLVHAARGRPDARELAARNELQTPQGILGSIVAATGGSSVLSDATARPRKTSRRGPGRVPAVMGARRKLRVALCISGQLRGYEEAYRSWDILGLNRHDTSIFVDCWSDVGLNWRRVWDFLDFLHDDPKLRSVQQALRASNGQALIASRYPTLADALSEVMELRKSVTVPQLREFYNTANVRLDDEADTAFASTSNQWKMHYKMSRALDAAQKSGQNFDIIIRARPDRELIDASGLDLAELLAISAGENVLFISDFPNQIREGAFLLGDQFAIGTPSVVSVFSHVLPDIEAMAAANCLPRHVDPTLPSHTTPFLMVFYRGILARPIPGTRFGRFLNPPLLAPGEIRDLSLIDLRARAADDFDARFLLACERAQ